MMQQLGHTDPKMTLGLYAKALRAKRRRAHARSERAADRPPYPANGHGTGTSDAAEARTEVARTAP